jgi:hypothetical protein
LSTFPPRFLIENRRAKKTCLINFAGGRIVCPPHILQAPLKKFPAVSAPVINLADSPRRLV